MKPQDKGGRVDTGALLASVDIVDVVGRYMDLKRLGREHAGLCPFHGERTASFHVNPVKQAAFCNGCGWAGDAIDFVRQIESCSFREACEKLGAAASPAERRERPAPPPPRATAPPAAGSYPDMHTRAFGDPVRSWPYKAADGSLLMMVARYEYEDGGKRRKITPQWTWGSEDGGKTWAWRMGHYSAPRPLLGLDLLAQRPNAPVLLVEGEPAWQAACDLVGSAFVCVTWPGGTGQVEHIDWTPLTGRDVTGWPDADTQPYPERHALAGQMMPPDEQPGRKAMLTILGKLAAANRAAGSVTRLRIITTALSGAQDDKQDGWDCGDAQIQLWTGAMVVAWAKRRIHPFVEKADEPTSSQVEPASSAGARDEEVAIPKPGPAVESGAVLVAADEKAIPPPMEIGRARIPLNGRMPEVSSQTPRKAPDLGVVDGNAVRAPLAGYEGKPWARKLLTSEKGKPRACVANAIIALQGWTGWQDALAFDEFAMRTTATAESPAGELGAWSDAHDIRVAAWLQHAGIGVATRIASEAVEVVSRARRVHPVRDYLGGLQWDGAPRLGRWLTTYCGAVSNAYTVAAGRAWMISAVARIMQPGCKVDMMLVLEGPQNLGKSTVFNILGGRWFTDDMDKPGSREASQQLLGVWIIEVAELASMRNHDIDETKSFISRKVDRLRLPYARRVSEHPRQCVFGGTVNPGGAGYLKDQTGNRRFLPVEARRLDLDRLRADRDQLWAEAVAAYYAGEQWWFTDAEVLRAAEDEQRARVEADTWESAIGEWLARRARNETTMPEVLGECLGLEVAKQDIAAQRRAGSALRALGWANKVERVGAKVVRRWKPTSEAAPVVGATARMFEDD